jgi:hypothetical protein
MESQCLDRTPWPTDDLPSSTSWETLQPGQSYTNTITWDGFDGYAINSPQGTGTFTLSSTQDPSASSATIQILSTPYPPSSITSPPPMAVTLSTPQATCAVGQSVPIALVLNDVSTNQVKVKPRQSVETMTVREGSTMVYELARKARALAAEVIKPGHPLKLTALWSGKTNQLGVKRIAPGSYTITLDVDGCAASTTLDLVSRRK